MIVSAYLNKCHDAVQKQLCGVLMKLIKSCVVGTLLSVVEIPPHTPRTMPP